jgi:hypothetical protein
MPLLFNSLLRQLGVELSGVRLLRHQDQRAAKGRTPYELWRATIGQPSNPTSRRGPSETGLG